MIKDILRELSRRGEKLSIAESCTGGLLLSAFTDIAGSSKVIAGGIIAYQDEVKAQLLNIDRNLLESHTAVSEAVAHQMAVNVAHILHTEWSLSTTGFLKPAPEKCGLVFIGGSTPQGVWTKEVFVHEDRIEAKAKVVELAIEALYNNIFP